jgi:uncharacterized NAD(P)/FAD-binding protein YdhS
MVAAHLLRRGFRGRVLLLERHGPFSGGVAYGTRCRAHTLNVPAGRMSAFADDDHFLRWMHRRDPGTHRHRAAPEPWARIRTMVESGQLRVGAARLVGLHSRDGGMEAALRPRGRDGLRRLTVGRVIDCTGPDTDLSRVRDRLIAAMREHELLRADRFGLDTDAAGALVDARGHASDRLFVVGPLRKGRLWENTAVPELRVEAAR